jgi:hypothetical protein
MASFNLFGGDESITLIEYKDDKGEFKTFDAARAALDKRVVDRLNEYKKDVAFVKELRYVRLWKLLKHIRACKQPADYQWHVEYEKFMNPDVHFPLH